MSIFLRHSLLFAMTGGLVLITGLSFLGAVAWFDVLSHFRLHIAIAAVLAAVIAALCARRVLCLAAILVAAVNFGPVARQLSLDRLLGTAALASGPAIISFNLHARNLDHSRAIEYLRRSGAELIVLTEVTDGWRAAIESLSELYPYRFYGPLWRPKGAVARDMWPAADWGPSQTLAILSRRPWTAIESFSLPESGRTFALRAQFDELAGPLTVIGVHLAKPVPASEGRWQAREIVALKAAANTTQGPLLVAGDFNLTPYSHRFSELAREMRLSRARGSLEATFPAALGHLALPIDHAFVRAGLHADMSAGPDIGSDHRPVIIRIGRLPA